MKKKSRSAKRYEMAKPIHWKRSKPFHVPGPKKYTVGRILNIIGAIIGAILIASIIFALSSCSITEKQAERDYELERLYLEYSYQRDSIIIEYNK